MKNLLFFLPLLFYSCGKSDAELDLIRLRDSIRIVNNINGVTYPTNEEKEAMEKRAKIVTDSINKSISESSQK